MWMVLSFVVILFLWERGQAKGFSGYWHGYADLGESFCLCAFLEKVINVYTPSKVIWIRYDKGWPPEEVDSRKSNKKLSWGY